MNKIRIYIQISILKFLLVIATLNVTIAFSQSRFEYAQSVYSTKDMNLKGKVKNITETKVFIDKNGKIDLDEKKSKFIYYFDESGKIIETKDIWEDRGYGDSDIMITKKFYFIGDKIDKTYADRAYVSPELEFYNYENSKIIIKDEDGDINEIRKILNSKVSEIIIEPVSTTKYSHRYLFEYNDKGQITKKTYKNDSESAWTKSSSYKEFEYNKNGDLILYKEYNNEYELEWICEFKYKYDKNDNWIECVSQFYEPEENKNNRLYTKFSRTIEYFTEEIPKVNNTNSNTSTSKSANGIDIEMTLKNYTEKSVLLGYNYGSKTYIKDTLKLENGVFRYKSDKPLEDAIYKVVMLPENNFFEVIIDKNNHHYKLQVDAKNATQSIVFTNSKENTIFYDYLKFIEQKTEESKKENSDLEKIENEVAEYLNNIIKQNNSSYFAFLLLSNREIEVPEFNNITDEYKRKTKRFYYYQKKYFDNIDFSDERILRTNFFETKIDDFLEKMTVQSQDSVIKSVDFIIDKAKKNSEVYKFTLVKLLNKYASSNIICMDAVYVHIGEKYYCNSNLTIKPDWIEAAQLQKICENVNKLKPILCGKKAPDSKLKLLPSSNPISVKVSDVNATYKVLVFWDLTKSNNNEMFTELDKIYPKLKNKNVEIVAIEIGKSNISDIENFISKYNAKWVNTKDSNTIAIKDFNMEKSQSVYILDENNIIIYKQLSYDQIESVIINLTK